MSEKLKLYYYGTYRYREMSRPKKFLTSVKDNIPCSAISPIKKIWASSKTDAVTRIKIREAITKANDKVFSIGSISPLFVSDFLKED